MREFVTASGALALGAKTYIMGILNVTPDSFSDGGRYDGPAQALAHTEAMINDGADMIDIGAVSTRPFSSPVSEDAEWSRLAKIVPELRKMTDLPLSVDTVSVVCAEKCLDAGVDIINDVSGIFRPAMCSLIKKYRAGWVLMHGGTGFAKTEAVVAYPAGIVNHVQMFFDEVLQCAELEGLAKEQLCLDPGFGFAKTDEQNTALLRGFGLLKTDGAALMSALSRKRFIGALSGDKDASDRLGGTLAANVLSAAAGADIIRTHEIALHAKALRTADRVIRG